MNLGGLGRMFSSDLAVDLGTANTRLYVRSQGVVLDEPSVVAVDGSGAVQAVGNAAKEMLGRAPGTVQVVRPLRHGVIADFDRTQKMFRYFINKTRRSWSFVQPRLVIVTPSGITQVERRAVRDAARQAGAREVYLIQASMAAALGAGLPVSEPGASMIVDIGGGTTEVAVMSLCGIVYSASLRTAGDEMNRSETVTFFNDMCVMAPATLLAASVTWELVDDRIARATFSNAGHVIHAELTFNEAGELTDFSSADRFQLSADGKSARKVRWSTPVAGYRTYGPFCLTSGGEARWHDREGDWAYIELTLDDVRYNVTSR